MVLGGRVLSVDAPDLTPPAHALDLALLRRVRRASLDELAEVQLELYARGEPEPWVCVLLERAFARLAGA